MDNLEIFMEAKKFVGGVLGKADIEFNDSVLDQITEIYLESLAASNIDIENVLAEDLVKNEDLAWACYDKYMKQSNTVVRLRAQRQPEKKVGHAESFEEPIDIQIENRMLNERLNGTIGVDEIGVAQEDYNEGRSR